MAVDWTALIALGPGSGVYQITNTVNGKRYIGSAVNLERRWTQHRSELNSGMHYNPHLQSAWVFYGADNFDFSVIELVDAKEKLLSCEQAYLDSLRPEYNIATVAGSRLGVIVTDVTRQKLSAMHERRPPVSEETKRKLSLAGKGRKLGPPSADTKRKMSEAAKRRRRSPRSDATKQKIGEKARARWAAGCYNHSPMRRQNGEANRSAKLSEEAVLEIRRLLVQGASGAELAARYGVSSSVISNIKWRRTWFHLEEVA